MKQLTAPIWPNLKEIWQGKLNNLSCMQTNKLLLNKWGTKGHLYIGEGSRLMDLHCAATLPLPIFKSFLTTNTCHHCTSKFGQCPKKQNPLLSMLISNAHWNWASRKMLNTCCGDFQDNENPQQSHSYPDYGSLLLPRKWKTEFELLAKGKCAPNPEP